MWFLVFIPLVLVGNHRPEPAAVFTHRGTCVTTAAKWNMNAEGLEWRGRYKCRHATARIMRGAVIPLSPG